MRERRRRLSGAFIIACLARALVVGWVWCASPAQAGDETMLELLRVLRDNGTINRKAYELLRNSVLAEQKRAAAPAAEPQVKQEVKREVAAATKSWPEIDTKGKLEIRSKDGDFVWRLGGRLQVDAAGYLNDNSDLNSGSEIRRARLEMLGTVWRDWDFKLQYDFTEAGPEGFRDAYIRYTGFKDYGVNGITVGQFKEPFSLEELTSSNYISFMERALPNVFVPKRARGIGVNGTYADVLTAAAGFFGEGVDSDDFDNDDESEGYGGSGRVTFAPIHTPTRVVHVGGSASWRTPDEAAMVRFRQRPESHVTDVRLVDTDVFEADDFASYGAEAAVVYGPLSLQGEFIGTSVDRQRFDTPDVGFSGWYVFGSWFLTGESRPYEFDTGVFGNLKPKSVVGKGGIGAWELLARYSSLDLSDGVIDGGEEKDVTLGLNWYPNSNLRLLLNYIWVADVDGGPFDGARPSVAQARAQVHW
jgi:phosphate-selective porin OprO/OprP